MKTAQELSEEIGMSIEAAQRALEGAAMLDKPFAVTVRKAINGVYWRWCGEVAEGQVLLLTDDRESTKEALLKSGYAFGCVGYNPDPVTERSFYHWYVFNRPA